MENIYKYFNSEHKESILSGTFRLRTYNDNRNAETEGAINDSTEGRAINKSGEIFIDNTSNPNHQKTLNDLEHMGIRFTNCGASRVSNGKSHHKLRNAHMFCVTTARNDKYWRNIPEKYDACIEILDFKAFTNRLCEALADNYKCSFKMITGPCFYETNQGTVADGTTKLPHYFRKPPEEKFIDQTEVRSVFVPLKKIQLTSNLDLTIKSSDLIKEIF